MKYDLALARPDFEKADRLVRSALLRSGRDKPYALNLVTSDSGLLAPDDQGYLEENPESLGVCFGDREGSFDIWVSPAYIGGGEMYTDTVLHELCHGYLNLYRHTNRWVRFFGRVLYHYNELVEPIDVRGLLLRTLMRYTTQGHDESHRKYVNRVDREAETIAKLAAAELPYVTGLYTRLTAKELPYGRG